MEEVMVNIYVELVDKGERPIEKVPTKIRAKVIAALEALRANR